jgi:hypothetical protein
VRSKYAASAVAQDRFACSGKAGQAEQEFNPAQHLAMVLRNSRLPAETPAGFPR